MEAHCVNLELKYQNKALKEGRHGQFSKVKSKEAKVKHDIDVIETINIELEHKVAKLLKENETLKRHYKELSDSIQHTTHYLPKKREVSSSKPHHMIAHGSSRYSSNDMVHNHYLEEAKKQTQEIGRNSKTSVIPSVRSQSTANGSKPKHRWKLTGKIFKTVGLRWVTTRKIFNSSTTKVDSEPPNGSNENITNPYECEQTLDVSAEEQQMQLIQDKSKESCMVSFQRLHSHLKRLSNNDLKGSRTGGMEWARAFATLFGQDFEIFTGTMFLNMDQLQKQLDNNEFQEIGSMASFKVLETQFQMFIKSKIYLNDEYIVMTRNYFLQYTQLDIPEFRETLVQFMEYVKKSIDERALHKREHDRRVNERQTQTTMEKVDTSKELDASSGHTNINLEQPEYIMKDEVDQNADQCYDTRPLPAKLTDNRTTELSNQLLESENVCLKKTVAQCTTLYIKSLDQGVDQTSGIRACALRNFDLGKMELENSQNNSLAKLPILKLGEYEMWEIRIKQYFQIQDYALWEVIENGNSWVPIPVTAPESARSLLLMALPNEHQLTFNQYADAQSIRDGSKVEYGIVEHEGKEVLILRGTGRKISDMDRMKSRNMALWQFSDSERLLLLKRSVGHKIHLMGLVKTELEKVKEEKEGFEFKLAKFEKSSKDLDALLASQVTDKSKRGFGYTAVPSPHPLILNRPTPLDLSYSGLEEFQHPEINGYGPKDSSLKPTNVCDRESNNSKENTDDSLTQQPKTGTEKLGSTVTPLKVDKEWKEKLFHPANNVRLEEPKQARENLDAPIIEDWVSDDEEEVESTPKVEKKIPTVTKIESVNTVKPSRRTCRAVLMRTGLKTVKNAKPLSTARSVNTVRPVSTARFVNTVRPYNTAHPKPTVSCARPKTHFQNQAQRPFYKNTALTKRSNIPIYYINAKTVLILKANVILSGQGDLMLLSPQHVGCGDLSNPMSNSQLNEKGFVDSGCSRHMSGNIAHLSDFKEFDGGYVTFGGGANGGRILVKLPDESQVLLKIPRQNNMYSFDMKNIVPKWMVKLGLVAKATSEESMLWHRRLGHVNFKNINKLVKENLVRDLPLKRFENDQTCVACLKGKQHRASCIVPRAI
ncbi:integrase, catalytic region, zinc finger, CCHC-type containing protein [Tanacetum coccineum]